MTDDPIGKGAEAISDLLTMLGVDPDERPEHGGPTTAETLALAVLRVLLAAFAVLVVVAAAVVLAVLSVNGARP